MLQTVEDEFARAAEMAPSMQLIFPAPNAEQYMALFETPRYYNVLLLAWLQASRDKRSGAAKRGVGCGGRYVLPAAVLTEMYLCGVCSGQARLRRSGRGQDAAAARRGWGGQSGSRHSCVLLQARRGGWSWGAEAGPGRLTGEHGQPGGAAAVASLSAAVLTEIDRCGACSCQEILRRLLAPHAQLTIAPLN
jgi:hypothetical protein